MSILPKSRNAEFGVSGACPNEFILHANREIPYYSCPAFERLAWLRHGFSTRHVGAGEGYLNPNHAAHDISDWGNENRRRLLSALDIENPTLILLNQIHSDRVYAVESDAGSYSSPRLLPLFPSSELNGERQTETKNYEGDALITNVEDAALAIKTADCFPILLADPVHKAVGAVHSGWRGTLSGVLPRTIKEMNNRFQTDPAQLLVAIGPAIRECCFEVGEDVARLFMEAYPEESTARRHPSTHGKYLVNLSAVLKTQMKQSGVLPENQHDSGMCTCCNTHEFFSWRAEGKAAGRMIAAIAIVPAV